MKRLSLAAAVLAGTVFSTTHAASLDTMDQRLSYILGQNVADQIEEIGIDFDLDAFKLALEEASKAEDQRSLSKEDMMKAVAEARQKAAEKQQAARAAAAEKNSEEGKAYLAENAKKDGVVTTESGLQYKEITAGSGDKPKETDKVKVHYKGTLLDGTVFDSSYDRGQPATFPVTGVIKGWIEALQLMNVGDKFELTIPSELAYGERGTGRDIGPNATLQFEVELLEIVK